MTKPIVKIVSFAFFDHNFLESIASTISQEFKLEVQIIEGHLDLSYYFDPSRSQYKGNELLKTVEDGFSQKNLKIIGLFNVDLFIPILTYIFGQAYLGGHSAIASAQRLNNARYGMKEDPVQLLDRMAKEVNHELGHTFGLIHCHVPNCVMSSSTYVEDIDQKSKSFCNRCREKLKIIC